MAVRVARAVPSTASSYTISRTGRVKAVPN